MAIAVRYAAFAAVATALNLGAQGVLLAFYDGPYRLSAALVLGTGVGLVAKYILDKYWIFADPSEGLANHARAFSLYTVMGLATTAVFWGTELLFDRLFGGHWTLVGGAIGLVIGYTVKYQLDRSFVFRRTV
ncbi:GtrA family protein [Azospirillum thermophilum]|uniref:Uncharacterized protein n=1 Tax=Azospirillum thermophilum TaxID=2202148 RepID=A0A2S2D0C3_9PROT|nr:GtrA family protein [Azospirillum thermophilum]AWK90211.1 hypothetical protein DEW08_29805 [Azospirillum thermophilum]